MPDAWVGKTVIWRGQLAATHEHKIYTVGRSTLHVNDRQQQRRVDVVSYLRAHFCYPFPHFTYLVYQ